MLQSARVGTSVLVVDDDAVLSKLLGMGLSKLGYDVDVADNGQAGAERLAQRSYDVLLVDLVMPHLDGFAVMKHCLQHRAARTMIVMTGQDEGRIGARAIQAGASDFLVKPLDPQTAHEAIRGALHQEDESVLQVWRRDFAPELIGGSVALAKALDTVRRVAATDCEVLIMGESGCGKELVARALHAASPRGKGPFVAVNCAAIPKELMESEVFGHVKGAFTGATERRIGRFQAAEGGTLFLDEIGDMDLGLQAKLLRVIQERSFTPVGDVKSVDANVRIVSATHRDLKAACAERTFREDLFFRLNVVPVHLPPLRERLEDIPELLTYYVERSNRRFERNVTGFSDDVVKRLQACPWPGNVRELKNLIERIVVLKAESGPLLPTDLPPELMTVAQEPAGLAVGLPEQGLNLQEALDNVELQLSLAALQRTHGNKTKAAELLGLKRTTLVERLKKLGVES